MIAKYDILTNCEQCTIKANFKTSVNNQPILVTFKHPTLNNTVYYRHLQKTSGVGYFFIRLPQSPEKGTLIFESQSPIYFPKTNFIQILPLRQKLDAFNYKDKKIKEFVNFAQWFCEDFENIDTTGSVYQSDGLNYRIEIQKSLINTKTNQISKSPARIGVSNKIIEIANVYFINYTIPERFCILAHEFGHGYLNSKVESEFEADRNDLKLCLGLGYPRSEIKKVFIKVFLNSPTDGNFKRWELIKDYINNFAKDDITDEYYYNHESK